MSIPEWLVPISNSSPHTQMKENTMAARLLLLVILLIFSVTILKWFKLGQFLTVSPPLDPDQQKNELHRQNGDKRLVGNIENSLNSDGQSKEQEDIVIAIAHPGQACPRRTRALNTPSATSSGRLLATVQCPHM